LLTAKYPDEGLVFLIFGRMFEREKKKWEASLLLGECIVLALDKYSGNNGRWQRPDSWRRTFSANNVSGI